MNSTDEFTHAAREVFDRLLESAGDAASPLGSGPDPSVETYYRPRRKRRMEPADFEIEGLGRPEHLEHALRRFWQDRDAPDLAELAGALADLAQRARRDEEPDDDVSPFVYVMF